MSTTSASPIFSGVFFDKFLSITYYQTMVAIGCLLLCFWMIGWLQKRKISFSLRMLAGLVLGLILGLTIQAINGFPAQSNSWMQQTAIWYGLFGRAFIAFIQMLVIPLIFVSIVKVILDFAEKENLPKIAFRGIFWLLFTTGIAAVIGIVLANLFQLGKLGYSVTEHASQAKHYTNLVDTFIRLIPSNIIGAMSGQNIVGLVIFSALLGLGSNRMKRKVPEAMETFRQLIDAFYKIMISVAMTIIKYMPYAIVALLARTLISNGIPAVIQVSQFVIAIYVATFIMLLVHMLIVISHGLSPRIYLKKALSTWLLAFSSRSSIGTLPMTIATLTERMGVNSGTANLVGSLGTTLGMNGCAGFFPAMLTVMVAHMVGIPTDIQFYVMLVIVVVIGSIGIAGIPGVATVAATIVLSGMGMIQYFPLIGMILAIDPIIDMARTMTNVSGTMIAAVATDRELGSLDMQRFNDPDLMLENAIEDQV